MSPLRSDSTESIGSNVPVPAMIGVICGSAVFVAGVMLSVCIYARRRKRTIAGGMPIKQFLLPKDVKPVISFKSAAGPGGLKKSPSPVLSPEQSFYQARPDSTDFHPNQRLSPEGGNVMHEVAKTSLDEVNKIRLEEGVDVTKAAGDGQEACQGLLNFTLRYNFDKNALQVVIVGAQGLPARPMESPDSETGTTLLDPYVKLQLLPEKQHKVKTRVVRNTLNPQYDEEFTFYGLTYNQLQTTTLHFAIVGFDRYSRDEILGEVVCPLYNVDLSDSDKEASLSLPLVNRSLKFAGAQARGDLLISLCYQPGSSRLTALVLKARNLPKVDITGLADPYVKLYLLYNGQRIAKKKSHVRRRTLNPVYNESFVFELPNSDPKCLDSMSLECLVLDWDRVTKNEVMGRMEVGLKAKTPLGRSHWDEMGRQPRKQIAEWHPLRP